MEPNETEHLPSSVVSTRRHSLPLVATWYMSEVATSGHNWLGVAKKVEKSAYE